MTASDVGKKLSINTQIPLLHKRRGVSEISALSHVQIVATSAALHWKGIRLEVGENHGCNVEDVMVDGHYLSLNLADTTLNFETRIKGDWIPGGQPPHTFWINPEGRPISLRHGEDCAWASITVEGQFLDSVMGRHYELLPNTNAVDPLLAHLMLALVSRLREGHQWPIRLNDELIRAFVYSLAIRHGQEAAESVKGGIAPFHLKALLRWLNENVGASITIDQMAAKVGLSVAHFSREFKRSTGIAPWGYFVNLRLDHARALLKAGHSIGHVAKACGFADHSHLARHFRAHFGMSPLAFVKLLDPSEQNEAFHRNELDGHIQQPSR